MINFMTIIKHFFRMYICVFHILKELFEEFYAKKVWSTPGTYDSCLMLILSIIHHVFMLPRIWFTFFGVTGKKRIMFMLLHSVWYSFQHSIWHPIRHYVQHHILHKNGGRFGGYGIGIQWWESQEHGFFSFFPPPATELPTTQFWLLNRVIIGSLCFNN